MVFQLLLYIYEKGFLTKGISRGDGIIGEDILENLKTISSIPKKINSKKIPDLLEVRCEIYIGKKDFENLKKILQTQEMQLEDLLDKKILKRPLRSH